MGYTMKCQLSIIVLIKICGFCKNIKYAQASTIFIIRFLHINFTIYHG